MVSLGLGLELGLGLGLGLDLVVHHFLDLQKLQYVIAIARVGESTRSDTCHEAVSRRAVIRVRVTLYCSLCWCRRRSRWPG